MNFTEQAVVLAQGKDALVGVLSVPASAGSTGVVIIVGGPQYRAGSHRQFVLLARSLAAAGYPVLRFDYRGMGDSGGQPRDFSEVSQDIATAVQGLQAHIPAVAQIALWGLCDGASAALLYCNDTRDPRIAGLCLLNPWVRSAASLARAHVKHYYLQRLRQKEFWVKLASGRMAATALLGLWQNICAMRAGPGAPPPQGKAGPFQNRMATGWKDFGGSILLLLSGQDYTAREFVEYARMDPAWTGLLARSQVIRRDLPDADHTFSQKASREEVERLTLDWLRDNVTHHRLQQMPP